MYTQPTFICATCDATIAEGPVFHLGLAFCCAGCAADGPCMCSYDPPAASVAPVVEVISVAPAAPALARVAPATAPTPTTEERIPVSAHS